MHHKEMILPLKEKCFHSLRGHIKKSLQEEQRSICLARRAVTIVAIIITYALLSRERGHVISKIKLLDQLIHVIVHPARKFALYDSGQGCYRGIKVQIRIPVEKVAEDTRERTSKMVAALFFDELTRPRGPAFEAGHDLGEQVEVAGIISFIGLGDALIANGV